MESTSALALNKMNVPSPIQIQLDRLRRHYNAVAETYDEVSMSDLSHTLRVWADLQHELQHFPVEFASVAHFETAQPNPALWSLIEHAECVLAYMPGGVITHASKGNGAEAKIKQKGVLVTVSIDARVIKGYLELKDYCVFTGKVNQNFFPASVATCGYKEWLAAEAIRLCYLGPTGKIESHIISRDTIIRRVANVYDASHTSLDAKHRKPIDNVISYLMQHHKMGGLPLPYFILLKIAQDILKATDISFRK